MKNQRKETLSCRRLLSQAARVCNPGAFPLESEHQAECVCRLRLSLGIIVRTHHQLRDFDLAHRQLEGVEAIGVDEIHWGKSKRADNFLTVIYQIDSHCRRLLWVGRKRTQATLRRGLAALGPEVVGGLRFVCSDMWRPYLNVIAAKAGQALHGLDRFHITMHLDQAVDQTRRAESARLRAEASAQAAYLKEMRWKWLRRGSRVRGRARSKLNALVASKLATARAWILKETFQHFWSYKSLTWARYFLDDWTWRALRSRIEPMKKVARMGWPMNCAC